jgi:hypothetical protein
LALKIAVGVFFGTIIASTLLYTIAPSPFQNIVYDQFLYRKITISLLHTLFSKPFNKAESKIKKCNIDIKTKTHNRMVNDILALEKNGKMFTFQMTNNRIY